MSTTTTTTDGEADVYIGLDIGTQGTKAVLYHAHSNKVLARHSSSYELEPSGGVAGRAEQHPQVWIDAVTDVLQKLAETCQRYKVRGIGVSGQQHGCVLLDENFHVLRPAKLWCDVECAEQATWITQQATELLGKPWNVAAGFTSPKVLYTIQKEPDIWQKVRWTVLPHDYVLLQLRIQGLSSTTTIIPTTDAGDASGTGVFDATTRSYVESLVNAIDPSGRYWKSLPTILEPTAIAGFLSPHWKNLLSLPPDDDVPLAVGSGDNMCSALGCGCATEGMAVLSLGTSGTIFGVSATPVQTGTPVAPFCDATGKHLPLVCTMSCTGVLQTVLDDWMSSSVQTHDQATRLAAAIPPGCHGVVFLPFLGGERTPNWPHATGALLGLRSDTLQKTTSDNNNDGNKVNRDGLLYRAALEGITYVLADALQQMRDSSNGGFEPFSPLLVVGGGSRNAEWRQLLANVLQLPLQFPQEAESAALGAAFLAGAAANHCATVQDYVGQQQVELENVTVNPQPETLEVYQEGLERYRKWSRQLFG